MLLVVAVFAGVLVVLLVVGLVLAERRVGPFEVGSPDEPTLRRDVSEDVAALNEDRDGYDRRAPGDDPDSL
ncbi:hypothetical protein GCM10027589_45870 [Actinocorallia lasiicapitis]